MSKVYGVRLDPQTAQRIEALARQEDRKPCQVIRRLVVQRLRTLDLIGSGSADYSTGQPGKGERVQAQM